MKRLLFLSLLCTLFMVGCNSSTEQSEEGSTEYFELYIASKWGYYVDPCSCLPEPKPIMRVGEDGEWEPTDFLNFSSLKYEAGYEYIVRAHLEPYEPGYLTDANGVLFWYIDEVLSKVQKDTELPDNVFIYTIGSPWGFDPRDPMLEYTLEHYKEIFGEDCEIYYPTKI